MSKLLSLLLAAVFAAVTITPVAFAAKHEGEKKDEMKKDGAKKDGAKKEEAKKDGGKKDEMKKDGGK